MRGPVWQNDPAPPPTTSIGFTIGGPSQAERMRTLVNEGLTGARIDQAVADWHAKVAADDPPASAPVIEHHPIDDQLQTGDSRGLGGAMSISAKKDPPQP